MAKPPAKPRKTAAKKKTAVKKPARTALAKKAAPRAAAPAELPAGNLSRTFPIELDPKRLEETLASLASEVRHWANKGRYTKVRFKFRGKQLLPDLPLAAVVAAESLTFYWGGILRTLLVNVAGNSVLSVELINDSEKRVQKGKEELLSGEVDSAIENFEAAISMERDNPRAHLNLGVAMKLKGQKDAARRSFEQAKSLDPEGPVGLEADRLLRALGPNATTATVTVVSF
jgi:tetratricopeptide (TPR) repeat protein